MHIYNLEPHLRLEDAEIQYCGAQVCETYTEKQGHGQAIVGKTDRGTHNDSGQGPQTGALKNLV